MNDSELLSIIKDCLNGGKESFSQIIKLYQKQIYVMCFHSLGIPQDAEDAATEIFIKIFKSLCSFDSNYKFSTWAYKIAANHLNDLLRKRQREKKYFLSEFAKRMKSTERSTPEMEFMRKMERNSLKRALTSISLQHKNALMLKYYFNLSYQEIGEIMDIPVNTVGSLLFRGKIELRAKLEDMGG